MLTGLIESPGVTVEPGVIGLPDVVTVPCLPGVLGGAEYWVPVDRPLPDLLGPGVTGACSDFTSRLTDDC